MTTPATNWLYRWVLGAKEKAQKLAYASLSKLHMGTAREQEGDTPGNNNGIPAGCVAWPVEQDSHEGASFLAADVFYAVYDAKKREVYMLDDIDGTRHTGAKPLRVGKNVFIDGSVKRSGRGTVKRTAEYGTAGIYKNVFQHTRADLIAHHLDPNPPDNSSLVGDPDENSERQGGLHYPLRVREWVRKFCSGASQAVQEKLFAPLLNMSRNGDGTDAHGAAHFARGEAALSDEAKGPLACADDNNHRLGVTGDATIHQGGVNIDALYGPIEGLYGPEEIVVTPWEPGSKGPFIMRVEKRPDFDAKHKNYCGKDVPLVIKWQTWAMNREYPPTIKEPDPKKPTPEPRYPAMLVPPETGLPPTNASPLELEAPSKYGHPAPALPDGEPSRGLGEAPGDALPEHPADLYWLNRLGWNEHDWNRFSNVCAHEFALPVYESSTRGAGANPWPVVNNIREGSIQFDGDGNIIGRDANVGNGTIMDAPAWARPWHGLASLHSNTWLESQHARIVMAGKNAAGVTVDGRLGLGARGLTSPFVASGGEFSLAYDGDGTTSTPDTHFNAKTSAAVASTDGTAKLVVNTRLKTTAGIERKTTDTTGNLTLDATHHVVNIAGSHSITLPATVVAGRTYEIHNSSGSVTTIDRNGNNINGAASDYDLADNARAFVTTEADAGGWLIVQAAEAAASAGIGGNTGGNDEAVLVADGVGGATLKATPVIIDSATGNTSGMGTLSSGAHTNSTADGTMARALENDTTHGERTWHDEVSTTDATVTTALEFALPTDAVCGVKIVLVGTEAATDYDSHRVYTVTYRENTGLTLVDSQADYTYNPGPVPAATIDVNGANARVRVTGIAATTIRWHCKAVLDYRTGTA